MEIKFINSITANKPEAVISHKGMELSFLISGIMRKSATSQFEFDVFEYLNLYWLSLTEIEQDNIFNHYRHIRDIFNTVVNKTQLNHQLNQACKKLTNEHVFQRVYEWILFKSYIIIPDNFNEDYIYSYDQQGSREQTYIRSDYTKLLAMILVLKTMIPIWGEYMFQGRDESGNLFKEYYSFQLLSGADILNSEAMEKLIVYIKHIIGKKNENLATITEGISSEDYPYWMLSQLCIHRLCVGDIRGLDPRANIVTLVYKYIFQKNQSFETNNEKSVRDKDNTGYDDDKTDKISSLEKYRIKHDISIGEIVEISYSIKDIYIIATKLCPDINIDEVNNSLLSAQILMNYDLKMPQLNVLRWVFKSIVSSKGLLYLDKQTIVNCLGVLEAVLLHRGFDYLAILCTSYVEKKTDDIFVSSTDSKARISKDLIIRLDELYPFQQVTGGKKTGFKRINPAIASIDEITEQFSRFSWTASINEDKLERVFKVKENRRITIPYDIKIQLANLIINVFSMVMPLPANVI